MPKSNEKKLARDAENNKKWLDGIVVERYDFEQGYYNRSTISGFIRDCFDAKFDGLNLDKLGRWRKGTLPTVKVHAKDKDILHKSRLIASYWNHPLKRTFKIVSKVLTFLLRSLSSKFKHFTLHKLSEIPLKIKKMKKKFSKLYENVYILPFQTDITCMFTNLDQQQIRTALNWLLETAVSPKRTNKNFLNINKFKPHDVRWGKGYDEENQITISLQEILAVVDLDLNYSFCRLGQGIFKQIQGCPIGGCLSSNYANIKCAYDEIMCNSHNQGFRKRVFAIRQMDDMAVWIAYDGDNKDSKDVALFYKTAILTQSSLYKGGLVLEEQPLTIDSDGKFTHKFAGSILLGKTNSLNLLAASRNKNWEALKDTKRQKILTFPHIDSIQSNKVKIGVQIGSLLRIYSQCSIPILAVIGIIQNLAEMQTLGYNKDFMIHTLNRIGKKNYQLAYIVNRVKRLVVKENDLLSNRIKTVVDGLLLTAHGML